MRVENTEISDNTEKIAGNEFSRVSFPIESANIRAGGALRCARNIPHKSRYGTKNRIVPDRSDIVVGNRTKQKKNEC